jgi:hypothetical protein
MAARRVRELRGTERFVGEVTGWGVNMGSHVHAFELQQAGHLHTHVVVADVFTDFGWVGGLLGRGDSISVMGARRAYASLLPEHQQAVSAARGRVGRGANERDIVIVASEIFVDPYTLQRITSGDERLSG